MFRPASYSGANRSFLQGSTKPQTCPLVTCAGQNASFSKHCVIQPSSTLKQKQFGMSFGVPAWRRRAITACPQCFDGCPPVPQNSLWTFSLCSWPLQHKPLRVIKWVTWTMHVEHYRLWNSVIFFLEVIKTLSNSQQPSPEAPEYAYAPSVKIIKSLILHYLHCGEVAITWHFINTVSQK